MKNKRPGSISLFIKGFAAPFGALGFVKSHKKLAGYFIVPFIINIFLLSGLMYLSIACFYPFLQGLIPQGDAWYLSLLRWVATPVFMITLTLLCILLYSITGGIIIAPFNDPLSGKVESLIGKPSAPERFSFAEFFGDMGRMLSSILKLLLIIVLFNMVALLLNLIPVVGSVVYSILGFMSGLFFLGYGFFEFSLDRRRLVFRRKLGITWRYKFMTMGLGLGFWLQALIPVIGFLALNLATIGATRLYMEYIHPELGTGAVEETGNDTV